MTICHLITDNLSLKFQWYINCKITYKCLTKKRNIMFTTNLNQLIDLIENDLPRWHTTSTFSQSVSSQSEIETLEDGKLKLTINTIGHNPKNILVNVTDDQIKVKAKKEENTSNFVKEIDLSFTLGKDYDGTKSEAKFENGLLIITIDKKDERKSKTLKISY